MPAPLNLAVNSNFSSQLYPHPYPPEGHVRPPSPDSYVQSEAAPASGSPFRFDLLPLFAKLHRDAVSQQPRVQQSEDAIEHYHWKGLLWQSFAFFGVENSFRLMTDPYFRYLTADKPFWHDYIASLKQWNMGRWSDGDDFLVAYVGHPMQGSVTEFIEIQNDPRSRDLEISHDPAYWKSRFRSFLWAVAYSTDQKVGPLGESALGSEGGYTYPLGCPDQCPGYRPGLHKITNNTGWVKFITTPVVGTMWTVAEDFLDRYVSDRIQGNYPRAVFPKILRGSLNPSRTMANGLRGRTPWYRDSQHPESIRGSRVHFEPDDEELMWEEPHYEIFPHFNALSLPINTTHSCSPCRQFTTGPGVGFTYLLSRWWDLEAEVDHLPNASPLPSIQAGGDAVMGTFGLGLGIRTPHYVLKASLRPGFLSYDRAYFTPPAGTVPLTGRLTHFTAALAITGDYGLTRNLAMRLSASNTAIRYDTHRLDRPPGVGTEPYLFWISPKVYLTNENWAYQVGPVVRF